ncbi:peptidase S41 [Helicobacter sp. MIT 00-7814]|uniref:S41 family peptidase n=1 Tax=unclassified Helicobacter TaxID=2593540 RepID=UPI000E1EE5AB|nr:peptidase S41 [Helicobacter sp. MIT 99-10781]RDU56944.1 peptidase S41 [Helicobacter sp. MIT 00-7814]
MFWQKSISYKSVKKLTGIFLVIACLGLVFNANAADDKEQNRLDAYKKLRKVISAIEEGYVDELKIDAIVDKAIDGLLSNLDAHSAYLDKKKFDDLKSQTEGEFGGIGLSLDMKDGALTVVAPIDNTPAYKAGIKSGDVILKINDESTLGMPIDSAVNLMRGKPKTKLELTIVRSGENKPLTFNLVRDIIRVESVKVKKIEGSNYAYVRVTSFDKNVTLEVKNGLKALGKVEGVVLDLRSNPGGLLDQAVDLSKLFIKSGVIVSQKGRNKNENIEFKASGSAPYAELPLVVLVNGGSASASEIVAGALQDHKRAILVGEPTFGKGSVQVVIRLDNDEAIKLTIAKYYLPSGRTIQAVGVQPDVLVYPGAVPESSNGFSIKEADLKRHLQGELEKIQDPKESKDSKDTQKDSKDSKAKIISSEDVYKDIQLKSAIDILKAWNIFKPSK